MTIRSVSFRVANTQSFQVVYMKIVQIPSRKRKVARMSQQISFLSVRNNPLTTYVISINIVQNNARVTGFFAYQLKLNMCLFRFIYLGNCFRSDISIKIKNIIFIVKSITYFLMVNKSIENKSNSHVMYLYSVVMKKQ